MRIVKRGWRSAPLALAVFALLSLNACADTGPVTGVAEPVRAELALLTQVGKRFEFQVEVAGTLAEKRQGLMFRDKLPEKHGMLFLYQPAMDVAMWMKNTLLSLDILFIDSAGKIIKIERDAEPLSEKSMRSGRPVRAVLEINGGMAGFLGVSVGDRVVYAPLWPDPDQP